MTLTEPRTKSGVRGRTPFPALPAVVRRHIIPSRAIYKPGSKWSVVAAIIAAIALHVLAVYIVGLERTEEPIEITLSSEELGEVTLESAAPEPIAPPPPEEEPEPLDVAPSVDPTDFAEEGVKSPPKRASSKRTITPIARPRAVGAPGGTISMSSAKSVTISAPHPAYPYEARRARITGSGVAVMTVNPATGAVTDVVMTQSTGSPILDNATTSAFRRWRFKPGTVTKVRTPITFTMTGAQY